MEAQPGPGARGGLTLPGNPTVNEETSGSQETSPRFYFQKFLVPAHPVRARKAARGSLFTGGASGPCSRLLNHTNLVSFPPVSRLQCPRQGGLRPGPENAVVPPASEPLGSPQLQCKVPVSLRQNQVGALLGAQPWSSSYPSHPPPPATPA